MDCVLPTPRAPRVLYTSEGRVLIRMPLRAGRKTTRSELYLQRLPPLHTAYLRHLFAAGEPTAAILATHHNVHFYLDLMRQIREAIEFGNLVKFSSEVRARYAAGPRNSRSFGESHRESIWQ
jgi:queuine tRNA-ribosyltransferase